MLIKNIPTRCPITKGLLKKQKFFYFSVNNYRNAHYHKLNGVKRWFDEWASLNIGESKRKPFNSARLDYVFFLKKQSDLMNFACVTDKFLQDALVKLGYFEDDNVNIIKSCYFKFGGYDKIGYSECTIIDLG